MKETAVSSHIRLDAARRGCWLGRNNSGGFYDQKNNFVRYGLGGFKDTDEMKSSDYIGYTPVLITPDMVGQILAVITAVEVKPSDWKFNISDKRCLHQKNFIDMVQEAGGYAGFATNINDFRKIIRHDQG